VWILLLFLGGPVIYAQISPGPLSKSHQQLEGTTKCGSCHNFGGATRSFKCLECHTEIQRRIDARQGYHRWAYNPSSSEVDCVRCHLEHNGRQFSLTRFENKKTFDHKGFTGFALEGKHAALSCEGCHNLSKIPAAAKSEIKVKDLNHTFLGLTKECTTCHKDQHTGQLGTDCLRCHSQEVWKPAAGFSHFRTPFPLTGLHQNLSCDKCHGPKPGMAEAKYKGLAYANCQSCHVDPHKGAFQNAKFQGTCETCHSTAGWKGSQATLSFNHQTTKFPLNGKHALTKCAECHKDSDFHRPVAHERCSDCHEDIHKNQFATRAAGSDCGACHNETSFKPALFTRESHQQSAFKLEGKHASVECSTCHLPDGKDAIYMTKRLVCVDCHADPHGGEFAGAPYTNKCELCHTQDRFRPSTFTSSRHEKTKFALTSAHAAVTCTDCHKPLQNATRVALIPGGATKLAPADTARQYHLSAAECTACHTDPHRLNTASKWTCESCHNARQWKELRAFDHAATKFALEGAHQAVSCINCHRPSASDAASNAKPTVNFAKTSSQCFECHEDIHGGQFMSGGSERDCLTCHTVTRWNTAAFDHNKTRFPLDGSHDKVRCAQCHTSQIEKDGKTVRLYRGTSVQCIDCHGATRK
jgi:hypothetical protein